MRPWALGMLSLVVLVSCSKSPTTPTPAPTPSPTVGHVEAIRLTPIAGSLPAGGGAITITVETVSLVPIGVAPNVAVTLSTTTGQLSDAAVVTDQTGHAKVTWSGSHDTTITATAGDVAARAAYTVATTPPTVPPGPNPTPGPTPGPTPTPTPTPTPSPGPTPNPQPTPAGDLVATITATPANPDANQTVTFAVALTSVTGAAVPAIGVYTWDLNGDRLPDHVEATPSASYPAGTATILLEVITADGRAVDTSLVLPIGQTPGLSATLAAAPSAVGLNEPVTLTASVTPTGNVGTLSYGWDVDGNGSIDQTSATNTTTTSFSTIGTKAPRVTVTSSRGPTANASASVTASAPALVASLSASTPRTVGVTVTFSSTVTSTDTVPGGLSFAWDFDGNGTTDAVTTGSPSGSAGFTYNAAGTYAVTVTVTSPDGRTATNTITITVS